ncbi:hypothetical protein [Streptomyces sp. NPDC093984]
MDVLPGVEVIWDQSLPMRRIGVGPHLVVGELVVTADRRTPG